MFECIQCHCGANHTGQRTNDALVLDRAFAGGCGKHAGKAGTALCRVKKAYLPSQPAIAPDRSGTRAFTQALFST